MFNFNLKSLSLLLFPSIFKFASRLEVNRRGQRGARARFDTSIAELNVTNIEPIEVRQKQRNLPKVFPIFFLSFIHFFNSIFRNMQKYLKLGIFFECLRFVEKLKFRTVFYSFFIYDRMLDEN